MRRILITGVAGLVASNLAHWILENTDDEIIGVDNLSGGAIDNIPPRSSRFVFYLNNVEDEAMDKIFAVHKPTHVVHAAAYAAECLSPFMRKYNIASNLMTSANVVNNCINHDIERLLFFSSVAVYGEGTPPFPEELTPSPIDCYGIAKYAVELDLKVAGQQHGLDWVVCRPHNIYGTRQVYWDRYRNVVGIFMFNYMRGLPLTIFGDGQQKRAFSYIDDNTPIFYKALVQENCSKQIINVGGIYENTILEMAETLIEVFEADGSHYGKPSIEHLAPRHEAKYAYPTYQKSIDLLGYEHKTDLKTGLTRMWEWAKNDYTLNHRKQLSFDQYEIEKKLHPHWKNT